jgi:protein-S-isoprenylcysteine O-methyltransferase Ste14
MAVNVVFSLAVAMITIVVLHFHYFVTASFLALFNLLCLIYPIMLQRYYQILVGRVLERQKKMIPSSAAAPKQSVKGFLAYVFRPWDLTRDPTRLAQAFPNYEVGWRWTKGMLVAAIFTSAVMLIIHPSTLRFFFDLPQLHPNIIIYTEILAIGGAFLLIWALLQHKSGVLGWFAPGESTKNAHLITQGPYRLVRHPMYIGYFLVAIDFAAHYPFGIIALLITLDLYIEAGRAEDIALWEQFGQKYVDYAKRTPRFPIPFRRWFKGRPSTVISVHSGEEIRNGQVEPFRQAA